MGMGRHADRSIAGVTRGCKPARFLGLLKNDINRRRRGQYEGRERENKKGYRNTKLTEEASQFKFALATHDINRISPRNALRLLDTTSQIRTTCKTTEEQKYQSWRPQPHNPSSSPWRSSSPSSPGAFSPTSRACWIPSSSKSGKSPLHSFGLVLHHAPHMSPVLDCFFASVRTC